MRCKADGVQANRGRSPPAAVFSTEAKSDIVQEEPLDIGREPDLVVTSAVEVPEEVPGED